MNVDIKDKLYKNISDYCRANHLVIKDYINDLLSKSFMRDKYGERPFAKAVPYEAPIPINKPTEVEIEVKKNEETKEYEVEMKKTTIPLETDIQPKIFSNEIIPIDSPMNEPDKKNLEEIKTQDIVTVVLEKDEIDEQVKEKPKRRKLK